MSPKSPTAEITPDQIIDLIFNRMGATYGRAWAAMWEGVEPLAVRTVWLHELAGFMATSHRINWALDNLPDRVPNAIEFKKLCAHAPAPDVPRLPEPPADPEVTRRGLEKLRELRAKFPIRGTGSPATH